MDCEKEIFQVEPQSIWTSNQQLLTPVSLLSDPKFAPSTSSLASSQPPGKAWGLLKYKQLNRSQWICEWNFSTRKQLMSWTQYNLELSISHFVCQQIFCFVYKSICVRVPGHPLPRPLCQKDRRSVETSEKLRWSKAHLSNLFGLGDPTWSSTPPMQGRRVPESFMHQLDPSQLITRPYLYPLKLKTLARVKQLFRLPNRLSKKHIEKPTGFRTSPASAQPHTDTYVFHLNSSI